MAKTATTVVTAEKVSEDVSAKEISSMEEFLAELAGVAWTSRFMVDASAPGLASNASRDVSFTVALRPPEAFDKQSDGFYETVTSTDEGDRKTTYLVRRASIFGPGATYYLGENLGRGHIGVSADGKVMLFHDRQNGKVLRRIERLPIYQLQAVRPVVEQQLVA